ncbi:hypothetical protein FHL15_000039 [Xylaria flabelliformis]|uniref:Uncharacterized protein n=1 Tax=Xylaria flabelliformis TaxID=2512241 RepID=A0A553IEU3_9PEZI|nr:hypothetical protein FHL15_000039 [Xylaria flabelliformis]
MIPRRPIASSTLECPALEWTARATSNTTSRTDAVQHHDEEPMEFILSSNWVLQTEGVNDFYEILYKRDENLEIEYDPLLHGFRVKCLSHNEVRIVALVKEILDQLVQKETKNGLETSAKIIGIDDWRKNKCQTRREIEVSEKYTFPRDVAVCHVRATWNVSESAFKKGTTTSKMLPENALVYIGASGLEKIKRVEQKLDTLARFFSLTPRDMTQVVKIFLYNEGDRSTMGEYRYVADGNDRFLRSYILDRFDWPHTSQRYPTIFHKSVMVRLNPGNDPWKEARSLSNTVLPIVKDGTVTEEFGAFKLQNWRYPAKDAVDSALGSEISSTQLGSSLAAKQFMLGPKIETWVSSLPTPGEGRDSLDCHPDSFVISQAFKSNQTSNKAPWVEREREKPEQNPHASAYRGVSADGRREYSKLCGVTMPHSQQPGAESTTTLTANEQTLSCYVAQTNNSQVGPGLVTPLPLNELASDEDLKAGFPVNICKPSVCPTDEAAGHSTCLRGSPVEGHPISENPKHLQNKNHDPFQHLIGEFRRVSTQPARGLDRDETNDPNVQASQSTKTRDPRLVQDDENDARSFHVTMRQKAGALPPPKNVFPEFDVNMMISINESLASLMAPLRMWPGVIDFRIELGRFYFLNVKKSHIQEPGEDDDERYYKLSRIQNELNKRHTANEKLCFTRVLTSLGADANYIARISDHSGNQMWKRPTDGRSSTYEFTCRFTTVEGTDFNFIVEIDATNFTSSIREFKPSQNCFAVHCTKRTWDFQLVLSVSQDLNDICGRFAEDLLCSLRVMPKNDRIPELEVSYDRSYGIKVLAVRTRNTACCISETSTKNTCSPHTAPQTDVQRLYISELWEMDRLGIGGDEQRIRLNFACYKRNNERSGMPPVWYEAFLKSDNLSKAFEQNETLEFGDEVQWVSEELLKSGAVEALIQKAADMVRNMDGVGYWNDNHQTDLLRSVGKPPRGQDVVDKFW